MKRFSESEDEVPEAEKGGNNRQRLLLLVLLLLVAVFGYLYYFTGLIRPQEEPPKLATAPAVQVKKPLPPHDENGASVEEKKGEEAKAPAAKPEAAKPAASPQPTAKPVAKPEPAKQAKTEGAKPAQKTEARPSPQPAAKAVAKPAPAAIPETKKPAPAVAQAKPEVKKEAKAAPPQPKKAAKAEPAKPEKVAKAEPAKPKPAAATTGKEKAKKAAAVPATPGNYTLVVGTYVVPTSMDAEKAKLKKAGVTPQIVKGPKKSEPMIRLFVAEFTDHDSAVADLERLKKFTTDAFMLQEQGKYSLYAGSYFLADRAAVEQQRLSALGLKLTQKKMNVPVSTLQLTAGTFPSKEAAQKEAARLAQKGIKAVVVKAKE